MKNTICLFVALGCFFSLLPAQNIVQTLRLRPSETAWELNRPFSSPQPFFTVAAQFFSEKPLHLRYAVAKEDRVFSKWEIWEEDAHLRDGAPANRRTTSLLFLDKDVCFLRVSLERASDFSELKGDIQVHFFNPGPGEGGLLPDVPVAADRDGCECALPTHKKRQEWCTTGNCPPAPNPSMTTVTHLIVHHAAGTNTSNNWSAVVTSIWNYHVNTNGWADIGYNWLVAPDGSLFQGRGDNVLGAHFCGTNAGTMGVCMLGTYTNTSVSPAAAHMLSSLLAWKCCVRGLDPLATSFHNASGLSLKRISGHRDGCSTECPGTAFYPNLPAVRDSVAQMLSACTVSAFEETPSAATEQLVVFPNPVNNGGLRLRLPHAPNSTVRFALYGLLGQMVVSQTFPPNQEIEVSWDSVLPDGAYWWNCSAGQSLYSGKILLRQ
jgi:hypothetical protein